MPDTPTVAIRRATDADAADVARLLTELGYPAAPGDIPRRIAELHPHDDAVLLACAAEGAVLGVIVLHVMRVIHADGPTAYINALVIGSETRGQGVGKRLLDAAERWARERGCRRLTVTSAERRDGAHAFYEACGMPYTGRRFAKSLD